MPWNSILRTATCRWCWLLRMIGLTVPGGSTWHQSTFWKNSLAFGRGGLLNEIVWNHQLQASLRLVPGWLDHVPNLGIALYHSEHEVTTCRWPLSHSTQLFGGTHVLRSKIKCEVCYTFAVYPEDGNTLDFEAGRHSVTHIYIYNIIGWRTKIQDDLSGNLIISETMK